MIVYGIAGLAILLIVVLIVLISTLSKKPTSKKRTPSYKRSMNEPLRLISIHGIELPKQVESISKREIPSIVSKIQRVYEKLDYKTNIQEFTKLQWHTWQVSMLFKMYKTGQSTFISNPDDIFPVELAKKSDKDLRQIMNDIMIKYKRDVETHRNRDFLSRDIIWSGRDVAIILYFLSRYQNFSQELK